METTSAVARVRFASAKPQRIKVHNSGGLVTDILCLEPGQDIKVDRGQWRYYIVSGTATLVSGEQSEDLPMGQFAAMESGEKHRVSNRGEQRAICLAIGSTV